MNRDFFEMLAALSAAGVEFLIVGAYAMAAYGLPRATGDIDIWVRPTRDNAERVMHAVRTFGAPLLGLTVEDLLRPDTVFQIGVAPRRIDPDLGHRAHVRRGLGDAGARSFRWNDV